MKILIISGIFPPDIGGPATYVPLLAGALLRRGDRPVVVTMSDGSTGQPFPYRVVRLDRAGPAPLRWLRGVAAVTREARDADVLLAAGLLLQTVTANLLRRKPLVLRVVSDLAWDRAFAYGWIDESLETFHNRQHGGRVGVLQALQAWALRRADLIIVPSRWLAGWIQRTGVPAQKVRVIPNALDSPAAPTRRDAHPLRRAIAIGRLVAVKRTDQIIRAVATVPEITLRIIGDGPEEPRLRTLASAAGVADRVEFVGRADRTETLRAMAASDVLVLASAHEGFPYVVLEAMAHGVPVIAPAVGGIPELIDDGQTGLLCDGTAAGIGGALRRLIADPTLAQHLRDRAAAVVGERFGIDRMVDETVRTLGDAIGCHR